MAEVYEHAKAVHLLDEGEAERAEAAVQGLKRGEHATRICKSIVACMREGHVADAEVVVLAKGLDGVPKLMSPEMCDIRAMILGRIYEHTPPLREGKQFCPYSWLP